MPPPLIRRRVQNVRVRRIHRDIIHPSVFADRQHRLPGLPTVGRLVEPAISARSPQRPLRGHIHDLRVSRINHHPPNVLGLLQPEILPALSPIIRPVNSVAVRDTALRIRFSRADPYHRRIIRIERYPPDRIRCLAVEQGSPCRAVIHGLPQAARSHSHIKFRSLLRIHRNRHHPPRFRARPDRPKLKAGEGIRIHPRLFLFFFLGLLLLILLGSFLLILLRWRSSLLLVSVFN